MIKKSSRCLGRTPLVVLSKTGVALAHLAIQIQAVTPRAIASHVKMGQPVSVWQVVVRGPRTGSPLTTAISPSTRWPTPMTTLCGFQQTLLFTLIQSSRKHLIDTQPVNRLSSTTTPKLTRSSPSWDAVSSQRKASHYKLEGA